MTTFATVSLIFVLATVAAVAADAVVDLSRRLSRRSPGNMLGLRAPQSQMSMSGTF